MMRLDRLLRRLREELRSRPATPRDWLLTALYLAGGRLPSKIHLQKAVFIAVRELGEDVEDVEFNAYLRGPWSEALTDALDQLEGEGKVSVGRDGVSLTAKGMEEAREAVKRLAPSKLEVLRQTVEMIEKLTIDELLALTYTVYGEHEKSEVADRILARRAELAVSMLQKGAVTLTLAARIAGKPVKEFIEELKRRGIKPFTADAGDLDEAAAWLKEDTSTGHFDNNSGDL